MIKKFQNPSGKLTYEEALRQAGERVESQTKSSIQVKGVNNSNRRVPNVRERAKSRARIRNREKEEQIQRYNQQNEMHTLIPSGKHYDPVADEDVVDYSNVNRPKVIGMSGTDPLMEFYVGGTAFGKPLQLAGKGILYALGRYARPTNYGQWASAKLISPEMDKALLSSNSQKLVPSIAQYISLTQQPVKQFRISQVNKSVPVPTLEELRSFFFGYRPVTSASGKVYQLKNNIPVENLNTYLEGRVNPARTPGVKYSTPDMYLIGQNIDREMAFLPEDLRKELVNYIKYPTPINKQKAQSIIDKYGKEYGGTEEFEKIIAPFYKRALGAKKATVDPRVTEYQSFYELPMDYLEKTHFEDLSPNVQGIHFSGGASYVRKPTKGDPSVPFHEAEHGYQSQLAESTGKEFTTAQEDMLNKVYKTTTTPKTEASKDILEKGSTNAELRRKIAKMYEQQHGKQSSYDELNTFIDNLNDRTVTQIYREPINGYHEDYIAGTIGEDVNSVNDYILKPEFISDLKQAWKYVPTVTIPITINQNKK